MRKTGRDNYVAAIALATTATHCIVAVFHGGPVAVPDVSAYLSFPQWISGGLLPESRNFFPGYGLLLTPVSHLDGAAIHTAALILNAVLAGCCVVGAAKLARSFGAPYWASVTCAVLAAVHPSLSTASRIAWPETLLVAVLLAIALLLRYERWPIAGLITGLALAVHPRAIVLALAIVLVAAISRRLRPLTAGLVPAMAASALLIHVTESWPWQRLDVAASIGDGPGPIHTLAGQWIVLSATSAGLAAIGLFAGLRGLWKRTQPAAVTFLGVSAAGMIVLGGWVLAGSDRTDTLLYGRYIAPWVVPLTIVGLVILVRGSVSRLTVASALTSILVSFVVVILAGDEVHQQARRIMTLGMGAVWQIFNTEFFPTLFTAAGLGIFGVLCARRSVLLPLIVLIALAVSSTVTNHQHLHRVGRIADGQVTTAGLVPESVQCLAHDVSTKSYALWLYRLELPEIRHQRLNIANGDEPCGRYVVATDDILTTCGNATRLGVEPHAKWSMWLYPSEGCS